MRRIYLDYAATAPLLPAARQAMVDWLQEAYGNPSSLHAEGRRARSAIDRSREILSAELGCEFAEVVFTSSGTEAAALAIVGAALANEDPRRKRMLFSAAEHHCVLETEPALRRLGYKVQRIPVDRIARVQLNALADMLADDVLLVAVMHANNELGTIQPVREVAAMVKARGALFFCDAVQTFTSLREAARSWTVDDIGADLLSISAHKVGGPQGVGALYIRAGTRLKPLISGGGQERELRAGTENVSGVVGFAAALEALRERPDSRKEARDRFLERLPAAFQRSVPNPKDCLPGHAHVRLPGVSAETALILLDRAGVSASSGAACSSGSIEPSHVLTACGYSAVEAKEGLRFTFGRDTTVADAEEAAGRVREALSRLEQKA